MLASLLKANGFRVGLYTSPHLLSYRERIVVDSKAISEEIAAGMVTKLQGLALETEVNFDGEHPTFFELTTVLAWDYFHQENVEWAVVEVGLGGTWDATNVLQPDLTVITRIGLDHTDRLGTSLGEIAQDKSGIMKSNVPCLVGSQEPGVETILQLEAKKRGAKYSTITADQELLTRRTSFSGQTLASKRFGDLTLPLMGDFQRENASTALAALELLERNDHFRIDVNAVRKGLLNVRWPGRFQIIDREPNVLIDAAHNPDAQKVLARNLKESFPKSKKIVVFGAMQDKDIEGMLTHIQGIADHIILTQPPGDRAASPAEIQEQVEGTNWHVEPDLGKAIEEARAMADKDDVICITGSIFLVSEALKLMGEPSSEPIYVWG